MPRTKTSSVTELLVSIDRDAALPLHRQLEHSLREAIRDGRLAAGSMLPSTRALAHQLGVSRGIAVEAYEQLVAEGYLASRPGGTTRVAGRAAVRPLRRPVAETPVFDVDFRPGRPDLAQFPRSVWLRSVRRVLATAPNERFGYLDGRGIPELREALAAYVNRVRGTSLAAADIVVCTGFAQSLALVAKALRAQGARRVAIEDPSDPDYRAMIAAEGLDVVGIGVDEAGLRVELLDEARVDAVVVTAAHQFPTGGVLPPARRAALVAWATRNGAIIIEDDYDAEFRYDREPIGAIQGLCPDHVVYCGSASKVLAPGLRLGWVGGPPPLMDAIGDAKRLADHGSPALDQLAFADFLARGELDHHLRRMRPIYRRRRDALLAALARHLPELRPIGASAGLHVLVWLPDDLDEEAIIDAAAADGIALVGLAPRRIVPGGPGGLIFGYGLVDEAAIEPAVRRLAAVIAGLGRAPELPTPHA